MGRWSVAATGEFEGGFRRPEGVRMGLGFLVVFEGLCHGGGMLKVLHSHCQVDLVRVVGGVGCELLYVLGGH